MADLEAELLALRSRIASAQRARTRAEMERDAAQAKADRARQQLHDEFGVSTVAEAKAALGDLEAELHNATDCLAALLNEIETKERS
jgi:hypothetical protein